MKRINNHFNMLKYIPIVVLLALSLVCVSCETKQELKPKGTPVKVQKIELQPVEIASNYISTLVTKKSTDIYPRVSGPIENIFVNDGDDVKKGQVLMTIESSQQAAMTSAAVASANAAKVDIAQANATLKSYIAQKESAASGVVKAKADYDRYEALFHKKSATQSDLDDYTNQYNQAVASLKAAEEQIKAQAQLVKVKEASYKQASEDTKQYAISQDYYTIRAPFDGRIGVIPVAYGEYVTPTTLLTSVTVNDPLELRMGVDSAYKKYLKLGMTIKVLDPLDLETVVREGNIWFISPKVDTSTQTVLIKAYIQNADNKFEADEVAQSKIIWKVTDGILVPTNAIISFAGQEYVYLVEDSKDGQIAKQTPVKLGGIQGENTIVKSGIKPGDTLIVSGVQKLRNNAPISIQKDDDSDKDKDKSTNNDKDKEKKE